jgi:hypothetical protein
MVVWGEDSHLVHVCTGGAFMEGPVDQIRGVPVRARKRYFSSQFRRRSILRGSWPKGWGMYQLWYQSRI